MADLLKRFPGRPTVPRLWRRGRCFSRPEIHPRHFPVGRTARHLSIFPRRQKVHPHQDRHLNLRRLFRARRQILHLLPRLQRPNHHLPPALAQRHPDRLAHPRTQTPLRPARGLWRQRLHRLPRPLHLSLIHIFPPELSGREKLRRARPAPHESLPALNCATIFYYAIKPPPNPSTQTFL